MDLRDESGDEGWAKAVADDWRTAPLTPADRALCAFAEKLTLEPSLMESCDVVTLREHGFSDEAIHDATQVVAYFNYINRIADALGTDLEEGMPPKPRSYRSSRPMTAVPREAELTLQPVTKELLSEVLRLEVAPYQKRFVASTGISLAQAHFDPSLVARVVRAGGVSVGFVMTQVLPDREMVFLMRFLIDERWQGLGFGARTLQALIDEARAMPGIRRMTLTFVPLPGSAQAFYESFGFRLTGMADEDDELEMELTW